MNEYISEDTLNNLFNRNKNVYGVVANPNITNENNRCFGKILLLINLESKKKITINDIVEFRGDKIKWRSTKFDDNGCILCLIDPYWCRLYIHNPKIQCPVRVLKSHVANNNRSYYGADEFVIMNKDEFIKRRLLLKFAKWPHFIVAACINFSNRYWSSKDYYKSLNETSKHYLIKHKDLKSYVGQYGRAKSYFNKKWNDLLLKSYQNKEASESVDKLYKKFENKTKKKGKVLSLFP